MCRMGQRGGQRGCTCRGRSSEVGSLSLLPSESWYRQCPGHGLSAARPTQGGRFSSGCTDWGGEVAPAPAPGSPCRGPLTSQAFVPLPQAQPAEGTKYRKGRGNQKPSREMEHRCLRTTSKGPPPCQHPRVPAGPGCLFLQGPCPAPAPGWRGEQPYSLPNPSHYKLPFGGI